MSCTVYQYDLSLSPAWRQLPFSGSLDELSRRLPQGAYTTFRTFDRTRVLRFPDHLHRLIQAANTLLVPVELDMPQLRSALRGLILNAAWHDLKVRLTLDLTKNPGDIYASIEPLTVPAASDYAAGVSVITRHFQRVLPQAKLTAFIAASKDLRQQLNADVNEVVMVDEENQLMEGLSSNFFGVIEGAVWTADEGVLPGITRAIVLAVLKNNDIPVHFSALHLSQIGDLSEAFITSTSRSVLPVRVIDDLPIGNRVPGRVTRQLMLAYQDQIQKELVEI